MFELQLEKKVAAAARIARGRDNGAPRRGPSVSCGVRRGLFMKIVIIIVNGGRV
jgi:hypothetical protein